MPNLCKQRLLILLAEQYGPLRKVGSGNSLFALGADNARLYLRYSKMHHPRGRAFFGLRQIDLKELEGRPSFIILFSDDGSPPVILPYAEFQQVIQDSPIAQDGQHKVQLIEQNGLRELYLPKQGRFNVNGYGGLSVIRDSLATLSLRKNVDLTHGQVQTLIAAIGASKGYEVFVPDHDLSALDWTLAEPVPIRRDLPSGLRAIHDVASEIDVIWTASGRNTVEALFEVEHSTPVYSGLLRFNDALLTDPTIARFYIVSNYLRRDLFVRQASRPTFQRSGLAELTSFLEYANVYDWYRRSSNEKRGAT